MKKGISDIYDQIEQLGKDLADSINQDGTPSHKWNALRNFAKFIPPLLRTRTQKQPETQPLVVTLPPIEQPEEEEKDGTRGVLANTKPNAKRETKGEKAARLAREQELKEQGEQEVKVMFLEEEINTQDADNSN